MIQPVLFEFADVEEARRLARLLQRQAEGFQLLASHLTGDAAQKIKEQAREAMALASRIDAALDRWER